MKSPEPYRHIAKLNHLKELVDEADHKSWIAGSSKWRERAELRIEMYPWELFEISDTAVNFGSSPAKSRRADRATISRLANLLRGVAVFVTCSAFFALPNVISLFASRPAIRARVTSIW
jgi:hypothetical protein